MSVLGAGVHRQAAARLGVLGFSVVTAVVLGCAGLDSANDSCSTVPDCLGKTLLGQNDPNAPNWSCLDQPSPAAPTITPGSMVTYKLPIVDWVDSSPIKGLTIQKCATIDSSCSKPLATLQPMDSRTDANVPVQLETGFTGFLSISSSNGVSMVNGMLDTSNAYVPETYYFGNTVYADRTVRTIIQVLRQPILAQVASNIGIQLDFMQAVLVLRVLDCDGKPASGVKFSIDKSGIPYTLIQGLPQVPPEGTDFIATDVNGQAGFANVPPGYVFVSAFVDNAERTPINKTAASATALPGQLTVVEVQARPYGSILSAPTQ